MAAVDGIFEQYGPDLARRPVSGGGEVVAVPVESGLRHAAEEVPMSPFVEQVLYGEVTCGVCGGPWPCERDEGGTPYAPGEDLVVAEDGPPVFRDVAEGQPFGSWQENDLTRSLRGGLAAVEREVLAAVARCEVDTRRLGPSRRDARFAELRKELGVVFVAAASGELVDGGGDVDGGDRGDGGGDVDGGRFSAGGVVFSGVDADHPPVGLTGGCEFLVRGEPEAAGEEPDGDGDVERELTHPGEVIPASLELVALGDALLAGDEVSDGAEG